MTADRIFLDRQTLLARCLMLLAVTTVVLGVVWLRALLLRPTAFGAFLGPAYCVVVGICIRILLRWVISVAPLEARMRSRARIVVHAISSAVLTIISIVLVYTVEGPLGYQLFAGGVVCATGQVVLSLVFGLVDCMVVVGWYARLHRA